MRRCRNLLSLAAVLLLGVGVAGAAERVVALPPFFVEEKARTLPWRYAEVAGLEVLSSCPDRLTRELVANHLRLHALLDELLPPALRWKTTEPQTLLFVDSAQQPPTSQEVVAQLALTSAEQERLEDPAVPLDDGRLRRRPPPPRYTFLPNLRLWDRDTGTLFAIVREKEFDASRVALTADYVAYLLRNRLPALPPWFSSGVLTLFARAEFSEDALTLNRLEWPAAPGSAALRAGPEANHPLLPLAEFFAGDSSPTDSSQGDALSIWQAQAALFVHWGLGGRGAPRRAALWQFVARAATEPVTPALFRECFGLDYATAQQQLAAYLPAAIRDRLPLRPSSRLRLPEPALRAATDVEIARLRGDWERLEIGYVKTHFPMLGQKYLDQARRTLLRAYEHGSRDPRLLAVIGLCEADAGNDAVAREALEAAAAQSTTLRPRASFELARLRFAAFGTRPRLTREQADGVLAALAAARAQQPPLPEVYTLAADVWGACTQAPTHAELAVLEEGVRLFPHRSELVFRTAELNVRHGFGDTARWLITLGITLAPDAATRTRFEALQARVNAGR